MPPSPAPAAPLVVALDGPAGSGKSTLARDLARELRWPFLDTGAMYRALTVVALDRGVGADDAAGLARLAQRIDLRYDPATGRVWVDGVELTGRIRTPEVNAAVSRVAEIRAVRAVMRGHQQRCAAQAGRMVAEGRDMGTAVFPDAALKVYVDASPKERVRRRVEEMRSKDPSVDAAAVARSIEARDQQDAGREEDPLRPAPGSVAWPPADAQRVARGDPGGLPTARALILDTTTLAPGEVLAAVLALVRSALPPAAPR